MIKRIKAYLKKRQELKKAKEYYSILAKGGAFLKFIHSDIQQMKNRQVNRGMRRRFDQELKKEGRFSTEMINYYSSRIDSILFSIEAQEMKKKIAKVKKEEKK